MQAFTLETDVLIIGGGAAGARAAYETSLAGLKTVLAVKGRLGKSGCSIFAGELGYSSPTDRHAAQTGSHARLGDQAMEFYAKYTHYLGDQAYMNSAALYAQDEFLAWIEEQGFYFMRNQENHLVHDKPHQMTVWAARVGSSGLLIMDIMRNLLCRQANVRIFEETTVTRLLKNDGAVGGACLFDYANGHLYIVNAKSVVLATGHSNYLSKRATGTREGAANGWVMAFEAGATLQDIEMQWYHSSDFAHPATWMRLHMYPNPLPDTAHRNRMYNSVGDLFFDSNWYDTNPVPYILQMKYLAKEVIAGRARFDGGYYSSYRHIEPHVIDEYMFQGPFGKKIGVDIKKEMVENAVSWHMNVGGVRVNSSSMETGVPGLLAAGSVNALFTGGIGHVTYDGIIAAKTAIERARTLDKPPSLNSSEVSAEQERIRNLFRSGTTDCWLPGQVKKKIRAVTWEHFNIIKSESSLNKAHEEFCRIEEEVLPRMRTRSDSNRFNYDRVDALDVIDMLAALKLQTKFSLFRKESRGPFYREDFPHTDNVNWLVHVTGHKGYSHTVNLESRAVDLPYAAPREKFSNYFDLDY